MAGRFASIDDYFPPAIEPGEPRSSKPPEIGVVAPKGRRRPGRIAEIISLAVAASAVAVLAVEPFESSPAGTRETTQKRERRPAAAPPPRSGPERRVAGLVQSEGRRPRPPDADVHRRKKRRRVAPSASAIVPVPQETGAAPTSRKRSPATKRDKDPRRVAVPAPPGTPLFHCYSSKRRSHYMTVDAAAVGQLEDSRADYDCLVVGNVYTRSLRGRSAIRLDEGITVWLLRDLDAKTRPSCTKTALYRHSSPTDVWYSRVSADGSLVGYVCS